MDKELQALLDAPLADPLKMYLPKGKAKAKRAGRKVMTQDLDPNRLTKKQIDERKSEAESQKLMDVLAYYARTEVPIERVALHTGLTIEEARAAMVRRGRNVE